MCERRSEASCVLRSSFTCYARRSGKKSEKREETRMPQDLRLAHSFLKLSLRSTAQHLLRRHRISFAPTTTQHHALAAFSLIPLASAPRSHTPSPAPQTPPLLDASPASSYSPPSPLPPPRYASAARTVGRSFGWSSLRWSTRPWGLKREEKEKGVEVAKAGVPGKQRGNNPVQDHR